MNGSFDSTTGKLPILFPRFLKWRARSGRPVQVGWVRGDARGGGRRRGGGGGGRVGAGGRPAVQPGGPAVPFTSHQGFCSSIHKMYREIDV